MAEEQRPQTPAAPRAPESHERVPVRLILIGVLALYLILFAVLNSRTVKVSFVFFSTRVSLIVALVLAAALGLLGGYLANEVRERRRRKTGKAKK